MPHRGRLGTACLRRKYAPALLSVLCCAYIHSMPRRRDGGPGPGAYESVSALGGSGTKGVSLRIGAKPGGAHQSTPGPADYVPPGNCPSLKAAAKCRFSKSPRFAKPRDDAPSPWHYTPRDPTATAERVCIGEKLELRMPGASVVTPGPGAYSPRKTKETMQLGTSWCKAGAIRPLKAS